jgi:hypothetical protein
MKNLPENMDTLTREEHRNFSCELAEKLVKTEENLNSTKLLISYLLKDPEFKEPRKIPFDIVWDLHQNRLVYYTEKVVKLKKQLTTLADLYESRFERGVVRRFWED